MKVLVAEDDVVSQRILQSYLEKWGYDYVLTKDGAEAWQRMQSEDFPLVLSDWLMPTMDGLELISRIRDRTWPCGYIYAILLTAKTQKEDLVQAMDAGADDFITKPFDRDELRVRLREGERVVRLERTVAEQHRQIEGVQQLGNNGLPEPLRSRVTELTEQLATALGSIATQVSTSRRSGVTPERLNTLLADWESSLSRVSTLVDELRATAQP